MRVDFYVLEQPSYQQALLLACKLVDEAYQKQQPVYIHSSSLEEANKLDALLWTFREDSFLPHNLYDENDDHPPPIQIGYQVAPAPRHHVLVNLSNTVPTFYTQYQRIIEIVFSDATVQQLARERYKHYRDKGCEITTHKMKAITL